MDAMHRIAQQRGIAEGICAGLKARSSLYRWQTSLYQDGGSVPAYLKMLPVLGRQGLLMRESVRFAGIRLLGREKFAQLAAATR